MLDETYGLLSNATAALVTSGTATLETALFNVPQVVCYKTNWLTYFFVKPLLKIKHFSLPNLLAGRSIIPELLQGKVTHQNLFKAYQDLEKNNNKDVITAFEKIHSELKANGPDSAAKVIAKMI